MLYAPNGAMDVIFVTNFYQTGLQMPQVATVELSFVAFDKASVQPYIISQQERYGFITPDQLMRLKVDQAEALFRAFADNKDGFERSHLTSRANFPDYQADPVMPVEFDVGFDVIKEALSPEQVVRPLPWGPLDVDPKVRKFGRERVPGIILYDSMETRHKISACIKLHNPTLLDKLKSRLPGRRVEFAYPIC